MSLAFLSCGWTTDGPRMMQRQAASSDGSCIKPLLSVVWLDESDWKERKPNLPSHEWQTKSVFSHDVSLTG